MSKTHLPDQDHVARYCKPTAMGTDDLPKVAAFELPIGHPDLSVNWLERFSRDPETAIEAIRQVIQLCLRRNGRFAVLGVAAAKEAIVVGGGNSPEVFSSPQDGDPSHASIEGYTSDDFLVAVELKALVDQQDVYSART